MDLDAGAVDNLWSMLTVVIVSIIGLATTTAKVRADKKQVEVKSNADGVSDAVSGAVQEATKGIITTMTEGFSQRDKEIAALRTEVLDIRNRLAEESYKRETAEQKLAGAEARNRAWLQRELSWRDLHPDSADRVSMPAEIRDDLPA